MEDRELYPLAETSINFTFITSLLSGFLLLGTGFLAGWYWQNSSVQDVIKVDIVENSGQAPPNKAEVLGLEDTFKEEAEGVNTENCPFVGSKNSDKYHSPDSAPAKRILAENKICFQTEEEAMSAGYEVGTIK